ncbi:30S ribosomal protein S17 [Buchnera aphidicola (Cinara tujafilina)]|uniref:Small ribosomal subunit protein uS17 n=1 Tax=Buchnera aphidicola (Cinara tujafilina) TaxID=261317 RepID=F7WZV1_9GAMM|nr:30S ribosomal protein S17 [Buchnera aphidicola]AEH39908.1 30S ribosomal protein S17 [Buchnera aphidicola (Cinara tujafilina)]
MKKKNILQGYITSNKMQKSIVVTVHRRIKHPIYKKFISKKTKLHVHDENNSCSLGDLVEICECRPRSKTKAWILVRILKRSIL